MNEGYSLNKILAKMDGDELSRLYMRVFNTPDGQLVLQDLKNRCYCAVPYIPDDVEITDQGILGMRDGMRKVILTIEARLLPIEPPADTGAQE
jgi:hypothetical protein